MNYCYLNGKSASSEYYKPKIVNLGDFVQSLAAQQFLPQVDAMVSRDSLSSYTGIPGKLIMNAWWHIFQGNMELPSAISPLYIGYHLSNPERVTHEMESCFNLHGPVGCRDTETLKELLNHGVECYFSGCPTLTLGKSYAWKGGNGKVLVTDCASKESRRLVKQIRNLLPDSYNWEQQISGSNEMSDFSLSQEDYFNEARKRLKLFEESSLVLTTKIHCALPCLAMGTPVILVMPQYDQKRFGGLINFLNFYGVAPSGKNVARIVLTPSTLPSVLNPSLHEEYARKMSTVIHHFVDGDLEEAAVRKTP